MSAEWWASNIVSIVALLVGIAGWWIAPLIARRITESKGRPTPPPPPVVFSPIPPPQAIPQPSTSRPYQTDLAQRAQRQLIWAAIIVPVVTLVYGIRTISAGTFYFQLDSLAAALFALLFAIVTAVMIGPIGAGNRRAISAAAVIFNIFDYVFLGASLIFLYSTVTALTHVFGIDYFVADLDDPGLTIFLLGLLAALSAIAWRVTYHSAAILTSLKRETRYP